MAKRSSLSSFRLHAFLVVCTALALPVGASACQNDAQCTVSGLPACSIAKCNAGTAKCELATSPATCACHQGQTGAACTTANGTAGAQVCVIDSPTSSHWNCQAAPQQCAAGEQKCGTDSTLSTCSTAGDWNPAAACPSDKPQCDNGACVCPCADGAKRCNSAGTAEQVCSGCKWGPDSPCATGLCSGNTCVAAVPACHDGERKCTGSTIEVCANGQWKLQQKCLGKCACGCANRPCRVLCKPPSVCVNGTCQRVPFDRKCVPACGKGELCVRGECLTVE